MVQRLRDVGITEADIPQIVEDLFRLKSRPIEIYNPRMLPEGCCQYPEICSLAPFGGCHDDINNRRWGFHWLSSRPGSGRQRARGSPDGSSTCGTAIFLSPLFRQTGQEGAGRYRDLSFLYRVLKKYEVDSIIHAASLHETTGILYEALKVNIDGTIEILEAARILGLRRGQFYQFNNGLCVEQVDGDLKRRYELPWASLGYISGTKKQESRSANSMLRNTG